MTKRKWVVLAVSSLLLGCGPKEEAAQQSSPVSVNTETPPRYAVNLKADVAGYYVPATDVQHQNWRLKHIAFKDDAALRHWMMTNDRTAQIAPVLLVFEDMEEGPKTPSGDRRTLTLVPAGFGLSDKKVSIQAISAGLGPVTFDGRWVIEGRALQGDLKIGTQSFENITLNTKTGSR